MLGGGASVRDAGAPLLIAVPIASRVDAWGPTLMKTEGDPQGPPCQGPRSPPESGVKDMAYTAYKFKPSFIEERLKSYKSNLMKFKGHDNLVANAVRVIRERLEADPRRYLSYGPFFPIRQIYHHMMAVWPDPFINPVPSRQPWRDRRRLGIRSSFCQPVKAVNRKSAALTVGRRLRFWRRRLSKRVGPRLIAANPSDLGFFPHCLRFTKHQDSRPRLVPPPMYAHCIAAMLLCQLNGGIDMQCMSPALNGASGCRIFSTVVSVSVNGIR